MQRSLRMLWFGSSIRAERRSMRRGRGSMRDEWPVPRVVCIGESMAVLLPDVPGPLESVGSFALSVGGAESNVACALSALGVPSAWVSRVGADGFGRRLVGELAARGVDTSGGIVDPVLPTGLYLKETGGASL